nr:hypothetical protein [Tanacetum cinerariifolium]
RSDKDSEETVKSGAGKDGDDDDDEDDNDDDEKEETAKDDEELKETGTGGDQVRESGEHLKIVKRKAMMRRSRNQDLVRRQEYELYRDVNINQGRGLQVTQRVEDTHVILTPVNPYDQQESSSMSSFVSSMLNPLSDEGVES